MEFGGSVASSYELCKVLKLDLGFQVSVICSDRSSPGDSRKKLTAIQKEIDPYLQAIYCPSAWEYFKTLVASIKSSDAVWVNGFYGIYPSAAIVCASLINKPVVVSPRGSLQSAMYSRASKIKKLYTAVIARLASRDLILHFTHQNELRDSLAAFHVLKKNRNFVLANTFRPMQSTNKDISALRHRPEHKLKKLLYVGRLHPKKQIEKILWILARHESTTLTLVGGGDAQTIRMLRKEIEESGLERRVSFIGHVPREGLAKYYESHDVLCLLSREENFGNVVIEALYFGLPVFLSRNCPWEQLDELGFGVSSSATSPDELNHDFSRIDASVLVNTRLNGREFVLANYGRRAIAGLLKLKLEELDLCR